MKSLIFSNWPTVLIVILFFIYVTYLAIMRQWSKLRETAYKLMLKVEKKYANKTGYKKLDYVLNQIYNLIPAWLRIFVSEDDLKIKLQEWYNLAKDGVDNGKFDGSVK